MTVGSDEPRECLCLPFLSETKSPLPEGGLAAKGHSRGRPYNVMAETADSTRGKCRARQASSLARSIGFER
jgi:hypothetical protein